MGRVTGSVLWLLGGLKSCQERLRAIAHEHGIAPERLIFADKMQNAHHLARYPLADLFLDTSPYGAHTTASDALWMGVPILTLNGRSFASRVCGSLVKAAGLDDLACSTPEEYVRKAVALGHDRKKLDKYRMRLKAMRDHCVLFDTPQLVKKLESLYKGMWADFIAGKVPVPDLRNLDVYLEVGAETDHDAIEVLTVDDYKGWWRDRLAQRNDYRAVPSDDRLWKQPVRTRQKPNKNRSGKSK